MTVKNAVLALGLSFLAACSSETTSDVATRHGPMRECRVGDFMVSFYGELPQSVVVQGAGNPTTLLRVQDIGDVFEGTIGRIYASGHLFLEMNLKKDSMLLYFYSNGRRVVNGRHGLKSCF